MHKASNQNPTPVWLGLVRSGVWSGVGFKKVDSLFSAINITMVLKIGHLDVSIWHSKNKNHNTFAVGGHPNPT